MAEDAKQKPSVPASTAVPSKPKPKLVPVPEKPGSAVEPSDKAAPPSVKDEKSKVIHIVRRLQTEARQSRVLEKKPWFLISLLACIVLPTLIAAIYFLAIAADRYVSEARFSVRSNDVQAADALGLVVGLPTSQIVSDSYIVADYIASLEMVRELEQRLPLRQMYRDDNADIFSRLSAGASPEEFVDYWQDRIDVFFDPTKQTIELEVQAFRPEHAQRIVSEIVDIVSLLVNELSAKSRRDAVGFAAKELARTELRVRAARSAILKFRLDNNQLDPSLAVQSSQAIATTLEGQRSQLASQLASVSGYLSDTAPSVQMLKSRISALDSEIDRIKRQVSEPSVPALRGSSNADSASPEPLANIVGEYQELLVEQQFAETAYTAALASLDRARSEAVRTQSYLAVYGNPMLAEEGKYPRRWVNISIVFVVCFVLWAIGVLAFMSVRDHMA